jgi:hypothetical protein
MANAPSPVHVSIMKVHLWLVGLTCSFFSLPVCSQTGNATTDDKGRKETIRVVRGGAFFTAQKDASRYEVEVPIARDVSYVTASISFNVKAPSFPGPALHSIVALVNPDPGGHQGRYFALQHTLLRAAEKGIRTNIDNLVHGFSATRTDVMEKVRTGGGATLHYRLGYDTAARAVSIEITDMDTGVKNAFTETRTNNDAVLVEEDGIRDTGSGLIVRLGLDRTYDHGGYYPPYGWTFSDLVVELTGRP